MEKTIEETTKNFEMGDLPPYKGPYASEAARKRYMSAEASYPEDWD